MANAPDWPRPSTVINHYERARSVLEALPAMTVMLTAVGGPFEGQPDLRPIALEMIRELGQQNVLLLVASIEATFQVDLGARATRRLNDRYSVALRRLRKRMRDQDRRVEIEDILDVWQTETRLARAVGDFKQVIAYRHWLAHGRYWRQKSGLRDIDPRGVWLRWESLRDGIARSTLFPLELS